MNTQNQKTEITDVLLRTHYAIEHKGPNPFYRCLVCGYIEVGVKSYLVDHLSTHLNLLKV